MLYDGAGNLSERKILREAGTATVLTIGYSYDELNRLTGITDPGSAVPNTIFAYDAHDNQTSVTDSGGVETEFVYDDFGRRKSRYSPDSGWTFYTYYPESIGSDSIDLTGSTKAPGWWQQPTAMMPRAISPRTARTPRSMTSPMTNGWPR
ncbi:MAG: hypothetical protein SD837_08395 [Candidatus Electrothrix scaldis]|nr:MAG: hypothetical protein SD837_08395 [Candidatus Electrothrix sp. GW3-3]